MTQIDATYRIAIETIKNVDDTVKNNLILPLNLLNEELVGAFNNAGITINDNTTSHIVTQTFTTGVMLVIKSPLAVTPVGVVAISGNGPNQFVESIWLTPQSDQTKIGVTVNWQPADFVGPCTFLLVGG